ncbi:MAG: RagB/SusD family nutrient uptake outer membrane protein [Paludibacter sp.]|nr:RagB/SusD family nutrient uptake outer membrane protein [Paludibacter sp.]MDD4199277.1 RagB/SusD family nutrient uptake outer membrane protein [Paludibacter sp.]MDD4428411.1 RagB/SusD family nutrient uptake outer membrane protein [Paludibacter sp.]
MKLMKFRNIVLLLAVGMLTGCDFMDCDESSDYTKQEIFESFDRSKRMVTNIYSYLPEDFCSTSGAMLDAATDDALHVYKSSNIWDFVNGTWSANRTVDDVWGTYYIAIRSANLYLKESKGQTFEDWKFSDKYQDMIKDFTNYEYEVRFLRAFYYFELIRRYHNVPFVLEVLTPEQANAVNPSTFEQIAEFIIDECTELATLLPINYQSFVDKETGRVTRGAALALKSRVTLYLASPLFSEDNQERWKDAARAAYEIIGSSSQLGYRLDRFANLFGPANNKSVEVILARPVGETGDFEKANFPMGVEGGRTSTCPTQNLVDAFEMTDGTAFNWSDPTMKADPYANRDPRLAMTVVYNNMVWPASKNVEIWEGGVNGLPLTNATTTGYYLRKYVNKDISFVSGSTITKKHHNWILFRYAEVLLNYAEAMVNAFHDPDYKDVEFPMSAREAVNIIRARSDVNMPALQTGMNETEFVKRLKNERRVELAFEGHRFWDIRRWKDLGNTDKIYGVKVEKTDNGFDYTKFLYENRTITNNLYFYPISNTEKYKNPNLGQNPGW